MSWLIEAYFEEGKQGPDHPESLGMKNGEDFFGKKKEELAKNRAHNDAADEREKRKMRLDTNAYAKAQNAVGNHIKKAYENKLNNWNYNVSSAKDSTIRHNRRHPDAKLETADIIEILQ